MELVCPAGGLASLKAAVDAGANAVYLGFRDATNARNLKGLNFSERNMRGGISPVSAIRYPISAASLRAIQNLAIC